MSAKKMPSVKPAAPKVAQTGVRKSPGKAASVASKKTPAKPARQGRSRPLEKDLIEAVGAGSYVTRQGKYVSVNSLYEMMTGYQAKELIGSAHLDYVHPDDRDQLAKNVRLAGKIKNPAPYEYRFLGKNGETLWFLETCGLTLHQGVKALLASVMNVTRLKQSEESDGLKDERYRALLREMHESYYEVNLSGKFTFINEALAGHLGYSREEMIGRPYRDFCDGETSKKIRNLYSAVYKTGQPFIDFEAVYIAKDGSKQINEVSGALIRDNQGRPVGFRGVARNINQRRLMEEELRKSEGRYRSILEATEEAYCEMDLAGNIAFVNSAGAKIVGLTPEQIIGKNIRQYINQNIEQDLLTFFKNIYKTGRNLKRAEAEFINSDGISRTLEIAGAVIRDAEGSVVGFRSLAHDITERKWAEEALLQSEAKYFSVIESIGVAFFETDLRGVMTFVNDKTCQDLGYTRDQLLRMTARDFQTPENAKKTFNVFNEVYKTGLSVPDYQLEAIRKDGTTLILELSILLQKDAHNQPVGFRGLARDVTERKKMEQELRNSEERYRTILEEIEEGYGELDLTGNWTFVNNAACKNLGYKPEEMIGLNFRKCTDEESAKKLIGLYHNVYETGQPFKGAEVEFITKQGNRRIKEISGVLIRNEQGKPVGFRSLARDVTERKWAENALLQSEAKYFSIIESIGVAYFETDLRGSMTFVNDRICLDLGYTRNELLSMSVHDYQSADSAQKTFEMFNQVFTTELPVKGYSMDVLRKDGTKATFELSISLMRDSQGRPMGFRGLSSDITERKKMEDALKASEERARTIIATIPDPYFENDLKGKFTYVNAAFRSMSGYSQEEMKDLSFKVFVEEKSTENFFTLYNTVFKTGLPIKNAEMEVITKSGDKRLVNLSVSLIRDNQAQPTGFNAIIRDITEKKKAEELIRQSEQSLREYSETLELRVRERTAELEKAKIAAEAASRAKSDFMANISHEFQTPLNSIIGFTKVLQDRMFGELNQKQEEFIRYIAEAGTSLSRIISEIVDASSAATGSIKLNFSLVSIVETLTKTTKLLNPQIEEKHQILTADVSLDADVSIEADEQKIQQILFHVLSNAVKYSGDGGKIHVQVNRANDPQSGRVGISISVRDSGIGIKSEDLPRLFKNFGTLESPYTKTGKGIGVGLSLTRQLLDLHGGSISVESQYGSGSCFTIFLPLRQEKKGFTR